MSGHASGIRGPGSHGELAELVQKPFTSTELLARVRGLLGEPRLSASPRDRVLARTARSPG
jgi:DNA-binding response OmpR family regulator